MSSSANCKNKIIEHSKYIFTFKWRLYSSSGDDGCTNYLQLNDRTRAASVPRGNILKCDQYDMPGDPKWYRFTGASGQMMATSCVPKHYCGTHAPGWLSGAHPTSVGQIVNARVCFHWGGSCCNWNTNIQIKKCNGFYVYKLHKTPVCWLRYCGNAGFGESKAEYLKYNFSRLFSARRLHQIFQLIYSPDGEL